MIFQRLNHRTLIEELVHEDDRKNRGTIVLLVDAKSFDRMVALMNFRCP